MLLTIRGDESYRTAVVVSGLFERCTALPGFVPLATSVGKVGREGLCGVHLSLSLSLCSTIPHFQTLNYESCLPCDNSNPLGALSLGG